MYVCTLVILTSSSAMTVYVYMYKCTYVWVYLHNLVLQVYACMHACMYFCMNKPVHHIHMINMCAHSRQASKYVPAYVKTPKASA